MLAPDTLAQGLNGYLTRMTDIVCANGGIVDKFIGDAIMAHFGQARAGGPCLDAVRAAFQMISASAALRQSAKKTGLLAPTIGIGVHYGVVSVGNIGHPHRRLDFTLLGDSVNLASRTQGLTNKYGQELLVTESVYGRVKDRFPCRLVDIVEARGDVKRIRVFTCREKLSEAERDAWTAHNKGMVQFGVGNRRVALQYFQRVLSALKDDYLARIMVERCSSGGRR